MGVTAGTYTLDRVHVAGRQQAIMSPDGGPTSLDMAALADELRQLMALRSRSSVRDRACPELDGLLRADELRSRDTRYAALARLLDEAIDAIGDQSHRSAAAALLGSGEGRWRTVAQRGSEAAAAFGCGWDAYRRRRTSGTSQLDDTLTALAETLAVVAGRAGADLPAADVEAGPEPRSRPVAQTRPEISPVVIGVEPAAGEPTEPAKRDGAQPAPAWPSTRSRVPRYALVTAGVALLAAFVGFQHLTAAADSEAADEGICSLLPGQVGDLPEGASAEMEVWSARFRAFARTLPTESTRCAGTMQWEHGLVIQPVAAPNPLGVGAIVAGDEPGSKLVYLNHLEYRSYRTHLDRYGVEMLGIPLNRADRDDATLVMLSRGALVGEAPPVSFVVMGAVWQRWMERGGLDSDMGLPISVVRDDGSERIQDFENGRLVIDLADPDQVRWEPFTNPAAALPEDIRGSLLQAEDGTSWYVDRDLVRHWVPTTSDYGCTSSLGTSQHIEVPAQAIATLTAGDPLRCS